jgi:hypothetical protein
VRELLGLVTCSVSNPRQVVHHRRSAVKKAGRRRDTKPASDELARHHRGSGREPSSASPRERQRRRKRGESCDDDGCGEASRRRTSIVMMGHRRRRDRSDRAGRALWIQRPHTQRTSPNTGATCRYSTRARGSRGHAVMRTPHPAHRTRKGALTCCGYYLPEAVGTPKQVIRSRWSGSPENTQPTHSLALQVRAMRRRATAPLEAGPRVGTGVLARPGYLLSPESWWLPPWLWLSTTRSVIRRKRRGEALR